MPVVLLCGEIDRLGASVDDFRGTRNIRKVAALAGGDSPRLLESDLADQGEPLRDEFSERLGNDGSVGDVFRRGSFGGGTGTGRGFRNLSSGFMVLNSELVELTLSFRDRPLDKWNGTFRTFTS